MVIAYSISKKNYRRYFEYDHMSYNDDVWLDLYIIPETELDRKFCFLNAGDVAGSLSGMQPMINCLSLDDSLSYTPLYLLPRNVEGSHDAQISNKRDWSIPLKVPGRLWFVHTANSFEETDNDGNLRITMDATACSYNWFSLMHMFGEFLSYYMHEALWTLFILFIIYFTYFIFSFLEAVQED